MLNPSVSTEPEKSLVEEIRKVALENAEPDSYLRTLLTIMRAIDDMFVLWDPLLRRHFSKEEYKMAKERIKTLVGQGKDRSDKYEVVW